MVLCIYESARYNQHTDVKDSTSDHYRRCPYREPFVDIFCLTNVYSPNCLRYTWKRKKKYVIKEWSRKIIISHLEKDNSLKCHKSRYFGSSKNGYWQKKAELGRRSKTILLRANCQRILQVTRSLIKVDHKGSWMMHLQATSDCLRIPAAVGHYNYLKYVYLYV